ncbi:MAG: Xaa-Pro aminopeptidase [Arenicellales bacterium WSBS_2016_MAG_OTU3]
MDQAVFARRRRGLMQLMGDGVAVIPTSPVYARNNDVEFIFRPDSDFYYLTHYPEPEAVAVLSPGRDQGEYILFCRERDEEKETWNGRRSGLEGAMTNFAADDAFPIDDIDDILPGLLENHQKVYYSMGRFPDFDSRLIDWISEVRKRTRSDVCAPTEFMDINHILHDMRLVKRVEEQRIMRKAAKVAANGHRRAMQTCKPGMKEFQVQAELEYEFKKGGSHCVAYPSIVAGGKNGCILHYVENDAELKNGDLLLIDAGCEIDCYASDITRTFPVNGKFTKAQRTLYELVLTAQLAAIQEIKPGNNWNAPHLAAVKALVEGLVGLKILVGTIEENIESGAYRKFYMHRTGHWLGMDVHDVGEYKIEGQWRLLEPGMVLTVEPGLYITARDDVDERWHNIGIRIEDDVLITKDGCEVLTKDVPKDADEIEALMRMAA